MQIARASLLAAALAAACRFTNITDAPPLAPPMFPVIELP